MQTIRDLVEKTIKESIKHLVKKKGMKELKDDPFLLESLLVSVLSNADIRKIKSKLLPIVKDSVTIKNNRVPLEKPIILGTHSLTDIELCQIGAKLFDVQYNKLFVACREREVVDTRMRICNVMHKYLGYSVTKIGGIFNKDHSTIIHWLQNHEDLIETSNSYLALYLKYIETLREKMPQIMYSLSERADVSKNFKILEEQTRISVRKLRKLKKIEQ